jgi:O-antigen ligase
MRYASRDRNEGDAGAHKLPSEVWSTAPGHTLTFAILILYAALAYFRPYELTSLLSWTSWLPYWVAVAMLAIFIPTQLALEGNLTARPREVNLLLLLFVIGVISIPQATSPGEAWKTLNEVLLKTTIVFIVMVNAMRTERRLTGFILLSLAAGVFMSVAAITGYAAGRFGERATVATQSMFGDPNSFALYLVTMIPLAIVLLFRTPNIVKKALYASGALIMIAGVFATLSRGGFLGLVAIGAVLVWKLGRRNRLAGAALLVTAVVATMLFAPGGYGARVASIFDPSLDPVGSATARQDTLTRSIWVALGSPLLGVGLGNYSIVGIRGAVNHNAFAQVATEMGLVALVIYILFMIMSLKRLRQIERETSKERHHSRFYYLSVGLQASVVGYMVSSFFLSVAYEWYVYSLVACAVCLRRIYQPKQGAEESEAGKFDNRKEDFSQRPSAPAEGAAFSHR